MRLRLVLAALALLAASPATAGAPFTCGGFALLGGAQLLCSHVDPKAPAQICTFSWTLMSTAGSLTIVNGSFLLPPRISNANVYQGSGFSYPLSNPIVLCQGRRDAARK